MNAMIILPLSYPLSAISYAKNKYSCMKYVPVILACRWALRAACKHTFSNLPRIRFCFQQPRYFLHLLVNLTSYPLTSNFHQTTPPPSPIPIIFFVAHVWVEPLYLSEEYTIYTYMQLLKLIFYKFETLTKITVGCACAYAWTNLFKRQDNLPTGFSAIIIYIWEYYATAMNRLTTTAMTVFFFGNWVKNIEKLIEISLGRQKYSYINM